MTYITICFYCQKSLMMRESILVKESLSKIILHRYHKDCYAKMTEPIARRRLEYDQIRAEMNAIQG